MTTIHLTTHIGTNRRLQIDLPTNLQNTDITIALTLQPIPPRDT